MPFLRQLANGGIDAIKASVPLQRGVNTYQGKVTYDAVAQAHNLEYVDLTALL